MKSSPSGAGDRLLERDDGRSLLRRARLAAADGDGRVVLVAGEAGVGKSALVRELVGEAVDAGTRVATASCVPLSSPSPLRAVRDLLAGLAPGAPAPTSFDDAFEALCAAIGEPTVLAVDDVQWADEATLDVVRLLARRAPSLPLLLLLACRWPAPRDDEPIVTLLGDLAGSSAVERIQLAPLSAAAVAELAAGTGFDASELHRATGGNPFFLTEVLASPGGVVPPTVRDAVLARRRPLRVGDTALLELVSLSPGMLEPWIVAAFVGDDVGSVDRCVDTGLLVSRREGLAFRHEIARLAVEDTITPARLVGLHRWLLDQLESSHLTAADEARLAHHAEAAGDHERCLRYATLAGRRADRAGAYREAAAQYGRALRVADGPPSLRGDLLERRSRACYLADDQLEGMEVARAAIATRAAAGDAEGEARALVELAGYLQCRGHLGEAERSVQRARRLVAGSSGSRAGAYVDEFAARSDMAVAGPRWDLARSAVGTALAHGDELLAGHAMLTAARLEPGRTFDETVAALEAVVEWGDARGLIEVAARGLNALGAMAIGEYRRDVAAARLDRAIEYCTSHTSDLWRINALALAARNALDRGRWDAAAEYAAAVLADPRDSPWPHREALLVLALVRTRRGDPGGGDALDAARAVEVPHDEIESVADLFAASAEVAWTEGRTELLDRITESARDALSAGAASEHLQRLDFWHGLEGSGAPLSFERYVAECRPYEAALATASAGDELALRRALEQLRALGAVPACRWVARELRRHGARIVERGPRPATRSHPAGLTTREAQVLDLLGEGLQNAEIARRLVISTRTVDHHVASILRKTGAASRRDAVNRAAQRRADVG